MTSPVSTVLVRRAVRRALISSTAMLPVYLFASSAYGQSAQPPIANAGPDVTIADTDNQYGEDVTLQGSGSSVNVGGTSTLTFEWFNQFEQRIATGPTPTINLPDGVHQLELVVTDNCCSSSSSLTTTSMVTITVLEAERTPVADAGPDRSIADSDGIPGENVTLEGSGTSAVVSGSGTLTFVWSHGEAEIATGPTPTVRLPDGENVLQLTVIDNCCSSSGSLISSDTVTITVAEPSLAPSANAGPDQTHQDTDGQPGERVTLDGSASTDSDGTITSFVWAAGDSTIGTGQILQDVELPDGETVVFLTVTDDDGNTSTDTVTISIGVPAPRRRLSDIALTPNQRAMARTLDELCARLLDSEQIPGDVPDPGQVKPTRAASGAKARGPDEIADLARRCDGILADQSADNQRRALDELSPQDFNAMRTPAVVFSQTQFQSVMDRLVSLRSGQRGTSLAGLNLRIGDRFVAAEDLADSLHNALGGGASSDESPDGLLSEKLGFWLRGNYGVGEKSRSVNGIGFESDQMGVTGGLDYRFGTSAIAGLSLGYGESNIDFNPVSQGGIETRSLAASLYGSGYVGSLYLDAVVNYVDSDYDTLRRIQYVEGATSIDRTATGSTAGDALSGGAALGYDFTFGGLTIAPSIGYYYVDTVIDPFAEQGASGLDLAFDEQNYTSSTANAGLRASYAWKTSWGVFIPHVRGAFVREFEDSADVFGVRFANDPFASSANPTPPIIIESDRIDRSYVRLAAGASAQFAFGIAGYFEYQRLEAYEQVKFHDFTIGLRLNQRF